jgi:DNA mismatch repair protein MutS2
MLYPKNIESKLGFDQIREMVRKECLSPLGENYVDRIQFSSDFDLVQKLLIQTDEFIKILKENLPFPIQNYLDVFPLLDKIRPLGAFLISEEFRDVKVSLNTIFSCLSFFENKKEAFPVLATLTTGVTVDKALIKEIERVIDDNGSVKSSASPELQDIRKRLLTEQSRIRKELDKILSHAQKQGYTDEDLSVTIRGGRMVIPVKAEYKRNVKGFIHDESASGQTVFIEPAEVLEINNAVRELEYEEKREIIRILTGLTNRLREHLPDLKRAYVFLGILDFIRAKARVCLMLDAHRPDLVNKPVVKLREARHPLLYLSHRKQEKPVIPLNLTLDEKQRIILISGPNAGGKSISLKTTGLLQYMVQCGFPVSASEGSVMGIFHDIFIDIGDEQSVENDLSTYSSHLRNMKHFLQFSGKRSLILIDEFGTGTEPGYGGAIAEAVLEKLNEQKVCGIITTHYANLKHFAENAEGVLNAAMLYDMHKLEPLYVLETGRPGSSFALEIASKTGLPKEVIENAKGKVGTERVEYDRIIKDVEKEKSRLRSQTDQFRNKERQLTKELEEYKQQKEFIENNRKRLLNEAKQEAKRLLADANQKIEETIRNIRELKADKELTRELRKELDTYGETLKPEKVKAEPVKVEFEPGEIKEGDAVKLKDQDTFAEVISIKGKEAEILIGELKSKVKLNRLQKVSRKELRKYLGETPSFGGTKLNLSDKLSEFSPNLDIRGMRAEEALPMVDSLIDSALIFNVSEIKIIHGKGEGILRTVIRDHVRKYSQVKSMEDEHADRGGAGVTIVHLK